MTSAKPIRATRRCQICRHEDRWRIELLRAGGASLDSLAANSALSVTRFGGIGTSM